MKNILIAGAWLVTALAAFGIGRYTVSEATRSSSGTVSPATTSDEGSSFASADGGPASMSSITIDPAIARISSATGPSVTKALRSLLAETNMLKQQPQLAAFMSQLNPNNIHDALAAFDDANWRDPATRDAMRMLLYSWGQFDPQAAIEHTETLDGRYQTMAQAIVVSGWGENDFAAASAWAAEQEGFAARMTTGVLAGKLAKTDPAAAAAFLQQADGDQLSGMAVRAVAGAYAKASVDGAVQWAQSLPSGDARSRAMEEVAETWAETNPVAAAEWIKRQADDPDAARAGRSLASQMARDNPQNALLWAEDLPAGAARDAAQKAAMSRWTAENPDAAAAWINRLPVDANADPYIAAYSRRIASQSPAEAVDSALAIADPGTRDATLQEVGRWWYRQDQDAASAWLQQSGLSAEQQASITNSHGRRRPPWAGLE